MITLGKSLLVLFFTCTSILNQAQVSTHFNKKATLDSLQSYLPRNPQKAVVYADLIKEKWAPANDEWYHKLLILSGEALLLSGDLKSAERELLKAYDFPNSALADTWKIRLYLNLSSYYMDEFEREKALGVLNLAKKVCNDNCPEASKIWNNLANAYHMDATSENSEERAQTSNTYYEKALRLLSHPKNEEDSITKANVLFGIASNEMSTRKNKQALVYYHRALSIYRSLDIKKSISNTLQTIGFCYEQLSDYQKALQLYKESYKISSDFFGPKSSRTARSLMNLAIVYIPLDSLHRSIETFNASLQAITRGYHPSQKSDLPTTQQFLSLPNASLILSYRMTALEALFRSSPTDESFVLILDNARLNSEVLYELLQDEKYKSQRNAMLNRYRRFYSIAMEAALKMNKNDYLPDVYDLMERSKSLELSTRYSDRMLFEKFNISKDLTMALDSLNNLMAAANSKIKNLSSKQMDSLEILEKKLLDLDLSKKEVHEKLSIRYPEFTRSRNSQKILSLQKLTERLSEKELVVQLFEGDSAMVAMAISKDTSFLYGVGSSEKMLMLTEDYLSHLKNFNPEDQANSLDSLGSILYTSLIKPAIDSQKNIELLTVIPDGILQYLPFELLISDDTLIHNSPNYLIEDFAIRYGYSNTTLLSATSHAKRKRTTKPLLAVGPSYPNKQLDAVITTPLGRFRNSLNPLLFNQSEASEIASLIDGEVLLKEQAQELAFKKRAQDYRVLHLAMHALVDDSDPLSSKLAFSPGSDTLEDGLLHTYEIFNMELNADLVVLSACNTHFGKYQQGEGISSIGRAFAYAGVPSLVTTHWEIDDKASHELMLSFYQYLQEGKRKSEALRMAKLDYLKTANPLKRHPYYWGGFVLIGNDEPIISKRNYLAYIVPIALLLIMVAWFIRKRLTA